MLFNVYARLSPSILMSMVPAVQFKTELLDYSQTWFDYSGEDVCRTATLFGRIDNRKIVHCAMKSPNSQPRLLLSRS